MQGIYVYPIQVTDLKTWSLSYGILETYRGYGCGRSVVKLWSAVMTTIYAGVGTAQSCFL